MAEKHLSAEEVEGVGRGEQAAVQRWLRHAVLAGCNSCLARCRVSLEGVLEESAPAAPVEAPLDESYDRPVTRAEEFVLGRLPRIERAGARAARVRALLKAARERRGVDPLPSLSSSQQRRLLGWPAIEAQLEASFELRYSDPEGMVALAEWAVEGARALSPRQYSPALVADFQARAWIELANAYRVTDDFPAAEAALDQADRLYGEGSGDIFVFARLVDVKASLRADQRRFAEAFDRLELLERVYRQIGELHLAGRALVSHGNCLLAAEEPEQALSCFARAEPLLDRERDPQLFLSCRLSLMQGLVDCRRYEEARELSREVDFKHVFARDPLNLAKVRWIEGLLWAGLGNDEAAEHALEKAGPVFLCKEKYFDAALVSLDLALVWLRQGKAEAVADIARDLAQTFEVLDIPREALVALHYLQEACRFQRLTAETVHRVKSFLEHLERDPSRRFPLPQEMAPRLEPRSR